MSVSTVQSYLHQKYGGQLHGWIVTHTGNGMYQCANNVLGYQIVIGEDIHGAIFEMSVKNTGPQHVLTGFDILNDYYHNGKAFSPQFLQQHPDVLNFFRFSFYSEDYEEDIANACRRRDIHQCVTGMTLFIAPIEPFDAFVDCHSGGILSAFLPSFIREISENNYEIEDALESQKDLLKKGVPYHSVQAVVKDLEARGFIYDNGPDSMCMFYDLYPYL